MKEDGFEYKLPGDEEATFFRWSVSDGGKDLVLIDNFTKMSVPAFFSAVEDEEERQRGPILLALIATSIRAKHPDWSPERITRLVQNLSLSELVYVDSDEDAAVPPTGGEPAGESSPDASKPSATPADDSTFETSQLTPI